MSSRIRVTFRPRDNDDALDLLKELEKLISESWTDIDANIDSLGPAPTARRPDDEQLETDARYAVSDELDALASAVAEWRRDHPDSPLMKHLLDRPRREEQMRETANIFAKLGISVIAVLTALKVIG